MTKSDGDWSFRKEIYNMCDEMERDVMRATSAPLFLDLSLGTREDAAATAQVYRRDNGCLPAIAASAYACMAATFLLDDKPAFYRVMNIMLPLLIYTVGCFEPDRTRWGVTTGLMFNNLREMILDPKKVKWKNLAGMRKQWPMCFSDVRYPERTLLGYCGPKPMHNIKPSVAGPLDVVDQEDIVLCTHTSVDTLHLVERMLVAWRGPASVAIFEDKLSHVGASAQGPEALPPWIERLGQHGLRQVVASFVYAHNGPLTPFDILYPANVLRQVALDAAASSYVLLADPAFIPSAGMWDALKPHAALGGAMRLLLHDVAPVAAALLVASFLVFAEDPEAGNASNSSDENATTDWASSSFNMSMTLAELRRLVEGGEAVAFDGHVCPLCRPHAWQWLMLQDETQLKFREAEPSDLHHPALLARKSILPPLPQNLHGLIGPFTGTGKIGWTGLPGGLKALVEQIRARNGRVLLLPVHFLHRPAYLELPTGLQTLSDPISFQHDLAFRHFLSTLPPANATARNSRAQTLRAPAGGLIEVIPAKTGGVFTLKQGTDSSLELIVMASIIYGSTELQTLLNSVPYTVHAVAIGVKGYWSESKRILPDILRNLGENTLVAIVDAYDMVLLPCSRSIVDEYKRYGKPLVMTAEKQCWPQAHLCSACGDRYPEGSKEFLECQEFPNVNGGAIMGPAWAVARGLEWMHQQGAKIGRDDQENKWYLHNELFPKGMVALDHGQRIFAQFFRCDPAAFRVTDNCTVISDYCMAANWH
eukprot:TRINITY_DN29949_c0_g1_i1.p1 TRINITY_DN29949_c0_g1~~TRINITY_DN29949_c0_g1_i1.p1  ORF type:complete len:807 (+),score=112.45 TRINITY_DN29949_c0_g1_i1:137-2422(+)